MFNGWLNTSESTLNILISLNTYDFIYQIIIMIIIVFLFFLTCHKYLCNVCKSIIC